MKCIARYQHLQEVSGFEEEIFWRVGRSEFFFSKKILFSQILLKTRKLYLFHRQKIEMLFQVEKKNWGRPFFKGRSGNQKQIP